MTFDNGELLFRQALGSVLRSERIAKKLTLRTVASNSRTALGYLSEVERGQKEASSEILRSIAADGLGVDLGEIIVKTGIHMAGIQVPDTAESLYEKLDEYANLG